MAVEGADGHRIAQAQGVELEDLRVCGPGPVAFVHRQDHGLFAFLEHGGDFVVGGGGSGLHIADHDDHVRRLDGDLRLPAHEPKHLTVGPGLDAARVHQLELPAVPIAVPVDPVPGDAGGILHDGGTATGEFIKQHGLAHIGPSHNGNQGLCHVATSCLFCRLFPAPSKRRLLLLLHLFPDKSRNKKT